MSTPGTPHAGPATDPAEGHGPPAGPAADTAPSPGPAAPHAGTPGPATSADTSDLAAALERLDGLAERPVSEHVEVYEDVHRRLEAELARLDGA